MVTSSVGGGGRGGEGYGVSQTIMQIIFLFLWDH